jgi:hypothetical protein
MELLQRPPLIVVNLIAGALIKNSPKISNRWIIPIIFGLSILFEIGFAFFTGGFSVGTSLVTFLGNACWNAFVDTAISVTLHQTMKTTIKGNVTDAVKKGGS